MKYKVIVRNPEEGTEKYIDDLTRAKAIEEASKQSMDETKRIYVGWAKDNGQEGYLNRDGTDDCPGEPW
jgi:hypothetical protein